MLKAQQRHPYASSFPPPGDGDVRMAMQWVNYVISIHQRENGGCASLEEAEAWMALAWLLLNPGPAHNVESAARLAAHAAAMLAACGTGPNLELDEQVATWRANHADGSVDRFGVALAAAGAASTAAAVPAAAGYGACSDGSSMVELTWGGLEAAGADSTVAEHLVGVGNFVLAVLGALA